jgi:hypothetical protein
MGKIGSVMIIIAMLATAILIFTGGEGSGDAMNTRGGLDDPLDIDIYAFSSYQRPGVNEDFYIYVYSHYNGSGYMGPGIGNSTTLYELKISISGFFDEDGNPLPETPVNWIVGSVYNNNGDGYTLSRYSSRNFFADAMNTYLEMQIKMDGISPGKYQIGIRADFVYLADWDGGTNYLFASSSFEEKIQFEVDSHIRGNGWPDYTVYTYQESFGTDNLYAGAMNKLIGISGLYSATGSITEVTATIAFPDSGITAVQASTYSPGLPNLISWRIDVPPELPPGKYVMEITLSYTVNGMEIVQGATMHALMVEYTPLLMPPPFENLDTPFRTYSRSNLPESIEVPFSNDGNVDLENAIVHLDLDNTRYVDGTNYFINEDSGGGVWEEGIEKTIASIPAGESRSVTFGMLEFLPRLPPGKYKIPIDYIATYYDNGSTGEEVAHKTVGHWTSKGYFQHRNILWDREYPEDKNSEHQPFLLIEILPDSDGPMIMSYVDSGYNEPPGTVNDQFRLRVENFEMYSFTNLIYTIHTDDGSPFTRPFSDMNDTGNGTLEPILRAGLSASSGTSTSSDSFYFYANIRMDASPGISYFKVDVEGYDSFGQPFAKTMVAYIQISSHQPRFQPVNVEVSDIMEDRTVEITVEVINMGLGGARNLTCYFISSNTGYVATDLPEEFGDVMPGGMFTYTFHVKPESERRYFNGNYYGYVHFSYFDDLGEFDELLSGSNMQVRYDIYDKLPDIRVLKVDAPLVEQGKEFDVTVTIMNIGGSTASDLSVLLPYNSAQFDIENEEQPLSDLPAGETISFSFTMTPLKEISDRTTYSFTMLFSYTDITNRERTFSEGEGESFNVRTKDVIVPSEQRQIVEDDGALVAEGTGNVILGILLLIAAIIFGGIIAGVIRETFSSRKEVEKPVKEKSRSPPKAKKMEMEEEEEEEDIEEDEEEEDLDEDEDDEMDW